MCVCGDRLLIIIIILLLSCPLCYIVIANVFNKPRIVTPCPLARKTLNVSRRLVTYCCRVQQYYNMIFVGTRFIILSCTFYTLSRQTLKMHHLVYGRRYVYILLSGAA